ncbi:unnamed protein product [Psylliodes chrysocephalus]|uniref:Uncharacterized protein n=1 Tax=Psylliodes chrysocephalus TaxID=3402493 RepID=A0A9P0CFF0_9CUCU|nr:unnamed protein product [Psylliodes chrysocephala]
MDSNQITIQKWSTTRFGLGSPIICSIHQRFVPTFMQNDRKIYCKPLENSHIMKQDLNKIGIWSQQWLMPLNINKCTVLHIVPNNPHTQYTIGTKAITQVKTQKDLGVIISKDIMENPHCLYNEKSQQSHLPYQKKC